MSRSRDFLSTEIIQAPCYRIFLSRSFEALRESSTAFSLSLFAKKAGFGSRGFIVDVIKGEKRLTARSAPKVIRGLSLSGKAKTLFTLLLEKDEPEFRSNTATLQEIENKIARIRQSLLSDIQIKNGAQTIEPRSLYSDPDFLLVYASLGSVEKGATKTDIVRRSALSGPQVDSLIDRMLANGVIEKIGNQKFKAVNSQIVFEQLGRNLDFQKIFLDSLKLVQTKAKNDFASNEKLFFHSVVAVDKANLPELKEKLKALATDFIHEHQADEGDHVATIHLSLF